MRAFFGEEKSKIPESLNWVFDDLFDETCLYSAVRDARQRFRIPARIGESFQADIPEMMNVDSLNRVPGASAYESTSLAVVPEAHLPPLKRACFRIVCA